MALEYYWKRFSKTWDLAFRGWHFNFGFWLHMVRDDVTEQTTRKGIADGRGIEYEYTPLLDPRKDIRILYLWPGSFNDPLEGVLHRNPNMTEYPEDNNGSCWRLEYEALSYVWGGIVHPGDTFPSGKSIPHIQLEEKYYLTITSNLDIALRNLRSSHEITSHWIDAICINQEDYHEKSCQLPIMQRIYAGARVVNIWLGPAEGETFRGMEVLRYLAESTFDSPAPWSMPRADYYNGLNAVLQRDWFTRLWVVQEAAVSRKAIMMCGKSKLEWTNDPIQVRKFIRRLKFASISPQWEQAGLSEINLGRFLQVLNLQIQHIERQSGKVYTPQPDILDIAFELRHRKASDRRDKLFAILGLVDQDKDSTFQPDYEMNVEAVFQRLLNSIEL